MHQAGSRQTGREVSAEVTDDGRLLGEKRRRGLSVR